MRKIQPVTQNDGVVVAGSRSVMRGLPIIAVFFPWTDDDGYDDPTGGLWWCEEDNPREQRMRKAAMVLNGYLGSYARGWCDGYDGQEPGTRKRKNEDTSAYEAGWLAGAAEAKHVD